MNFGRVITPECENLPPPPDARCNDPAFALANPDVCPIAAQLIIKPQSALTCALGSVQFKAYVVENGKETDVTSSTIFQSSDGSIALIGATSGNATGISAGTATVSAAYQNMRAFSELNVFGGNGGDCCDQEHVAMLLLIDTSRSESQAFSSNYASKLIFAKAAATAFADSINANKDSIGLMTFNATSSNLLADLTANKASVVSLISGISQTQEGTAFYSALTSALSTLAASSADRKMLVLITDGEDNSTTYANGNNPIQLLNDFKASGGIVSVLGTRASGKGYNLLQALATGGFFINSYAATEADSITLLLGIKGYVCAGNCVPEGDVIVPKGQLDYTDFTNWNVTGGTVDLQGNGFFDFLPGNGLYVDMAGTTPPDQRGLMTLKTPITVVKSGVYRLTVELAGNQRLDAMPESVRVRAFYLSGLTPVYVVDQKVLVNDFKQPFQLYSYNFTAPDNVDIIISLQQEDQPPNTDKSLGIFLGSVKFEYITNAQVLFFDDFDAENPTYVPPRCGIGTTYTSAGYVTGTNCYSDGCLDAPPGAQLADPNPLPDIESGYTAPTTYSSTKQACATCPTGQVNIAPDDLIPVLTANSGSDIGTAFASPSNTTAWKAFNGDLDDPWGASNIHSGSVGFHFTDKLKVNAYSITNTSTTIYAAPASWVFEGSNDGASYTALDTRSNIGFTYSERKTFQFPNSTEYAYYRLRVTSNSGGFDTQNLFIGELEMHGGAPVQVCRSATATSTLSQADADSKAYAAALALAQAELNCQVQYTSTQQYTARCANGALGSEVTKSATATSLSSQADADAQALAAAQAAANADLDCTTSNNTQKITIHDHTSATPYPSIKYVKELSGVISRVRLKLFGLTHEFPADIVMILMAPNGATCAVMCNAGGNHAISGLNITFDDLAVTPLPNASQIFSGSYLTGPYTPFTNLNAPGPQPAYGQSGLTAAFAGLDPNGAWSLWILDDTALNAGEITNGWDLEIDTV